MPTDPIILIGAGGHAKVVLDALLADGFSINTIRVFDENPALQGNTWMGIMVEPLVFTETMAGILFHVAIGTGAIRKTLMIRPLAFDLSPVTVKHPLSALSPFSTCGVACFLAAQSVIGPGAVLGNSVIVNHGAVVDHDCVVGDFSHVAPNATLGGNVVVGREVLIGAGATVLPGITIGDRARIGAGAVVVSHVPVSETYVGVPAIAIKEY